MAANIVTENWDGTHIREDGVETLSVYNENGGTETFVHQSLIEKLPPVTDADNGKVAGVVDGKWQAMEAPSGMPEVTEADNGKVAGVVDGVWQVMAAPKTYAHPPTHPASMITGLKPVATLGTYESLYNTPVGPKYVIPKHSTRFEFRGDPQRWMFSTVAEYAPNIGTECEVEWEGIIALKTVRDCAEVAGLDGEGYGFIGNAHIFTGDDADNTGEEFLFVFVHQQWPIVLCYTNYRNAANALFDFQITIPGQVKKLDSKYLPDGIATEQFVRQAVAAGGGAAVTEKEILAEQVLAGFAQQASFGDAYVVTLESSALQLVLGETYKVLWDGKEYTCVCFRAEFGGMKFYAIGNGALGGLEDTGEPFAIGTTEPGQIADVSIIGTADTAPEHTIRIYQVVSDKVFYEETVSRPFLSDAAMVFTCDPASESTFGATTPLSDDLASAWIDGDWDTATVRWDGKSYTTKRFTLEGLLCVGNGNIMIGSGDNGEPFVITVAPAGILSEMPVMIVMSAYDTPDPNAETVFTVQHTLGVDINQIVVHKIEDKYQHQADWLENDESKAGHILNRPFGKLLDGGEVLVSTSGEYDPEDLGFTLCTGNFPNSLTSLISPDKVVIGGRYTIQVGDDVYTGVGVNPELYVETASPKALINVIDGDIAAGLLLVEYVFTGLSFLKFDNPDYRNRYSNNGEMNGETYQVTVTTEETIKTIDHKFLPSPPEFDLTAMGLPDVPMDGTMVSAECDTTDLMTALSKGPVWYSANYTYQGTTFRATGMSSQVASNGVYQLTNINYFGGFIFVGIVIVANGQIQALCKPITMS